MFLDPPQISLHFVLKNWWPSVYQTISVLIIGNGYHYCLLGHNLTLCAFRKLFKEHQLWFIIVSQKCVFLKLCFQINCLWNWFTEIKPLHEFWEYPNRLQVKSRNMKHLQMDKHSFISWEKTTSWVAYQHDFWRDFFLSEKNLKIVCSGNMIWALSFYKALLTTARCSPPHQTSISFIIFLPNFAPFTSV